jgi:hypothetical protein
MGHLPFENTKGSLIETAFIFINGLLKNGSAHSPRKVQVT